MNLRIILGDQLSEFISSLRDCTRGSKFDSAHEDLVLLCEVKSEATYVKHHKKKIAFIFSSMRHFAAELREKGLKVAYVEFDTKDNSGSLTGQVKKIIQKHEIKKLIITSPGEYRVLQEIKKWEKLFPLKVEIREDDRFLCSTDEYKKWAGSKKELTMEYFYRYMRKKYAILLDGDKPIGGKWNFDRENRKTPQKNLYVPKPFIAKKDNITKDVIKLVSENFPTHFGDLDDFNFAVTRTEALEVLKKFIKERLPYFGDFQDAMLENEPWMYHSHISFYLNIGLLLPMECIKAAEHAFHKGNAPLNAVEGFIRQILGWREYIRGIYWLRMPSYADENYLNAKRKLPAFFWDADTDMNCLRQCVLETKKNAYAHHIQRLMVLGNFTLLAFVDPLEVNEWYLSVYADAFEWVEMPNVTGMILHADGGYLASKPYAASGSYINKMSNYCKNCHYDVSIKNGEKACPFNYLYWNFLARNQNKLKNNRRLSMIYNIYNKMTIAKKEMIKEDSNKFFAKISK